MDLDTNLGRNQMIGMQNLKNTKIIKSVDRTKEVRSKLPCKFNRFLIKSPERRFLKN